MSEDPTETLPAGRPNLTPGPTDRGGHGGMATREAEAREASADAGDAGDEPVDADRD